MDVLLVTDLEDTDSYQNAFAVGRKDSTKRYVLYTKEKKTKAMWLRELHDTLEASGSDKMRAEGVGGRVHTDLQESHTEHQLKMIDIQNKVEGIKVRIHIYSLYLLSLSLSLSLSLFSHSPISHFLIISHHWTNGAAHSLSPIHRILSVPTVPSCAKVLLQESRTRIAISTSSTTCCW